MMKDNGEMLRNDRSNDNHLLSNSDGGRQMWDIMDVENLRPGMISKEHLAQG